MDDDDLAVDRAGQGGRRGRDPRPHRRFEGDVRTMVRGRLPRSLRSQFDSMDFVQAVWQSVLTKEGQDLGRFDERAALPRVPRGGGPEQGVRGAPAADADAEVQPRPRGAALRPPGRSRDAARGAGARPVAEPGRPGRRPARAARRGPEPAGGGGGRAPPPGPDVRGDRRADRAARAVGPPDHRGDPPADGGPEMAMTPDPGRGPRRGRGGRRLRSAGRLDRRVSRPAGPRRAGLARADARRDPGRVHGALGAGRVARDRGVPRPARPGRPADAVELIYHAYLPGRVGGPRPRSRRLPRPVPRRTARPLERLFGLHGRSTTSQLRRSGRPRRRCPRSATRSARTSSSASWARGGSPGSSSPSRPTSTTAWWS